MAQLQDADAWASTGPGGAPSAALRVVADLDVRLGLPVGGISAAAPEAGHRLHAAVGPHDLRSFDDLELWVRGDRRADGSEAWPWYLELRLGSAGLPVGADGNRWRRFVPLRGDGRWEAVAVGLADLPAVVRGAVDAVRFTCVDASRPFACAIDGPWAVRPSALADVDDALAALLDGALTLDGTPVRLSFDPGPPAPSPSLRARQTSIRVRADLATGVNRPTDFAPGRVVLRPPALPVELGYELQARTADRAQQAAVLEFAVAALAAHPVLDVLGRTARLALVDGAAAPAGGEPALAIEVLTTLRPPVAATAAVPVFNDVDVEVDSRAAL